LNLSIDLGKDLSAIGQIYIFSNKSIGSLPTDTLLSITANSTCAVTSVSLSLETSCNKLSLTGDFFITFVLTCRWSLKFADFQYLTLHSLTTKIALNWSLNCLWLSLK